MNIQQQPKYQYVEMINFSQVKKHKTIIDSSVFKDPKSESYKHNINLLEVKFLKENKNFFN